MSRMFQCLNEERLTLVGIEGSKIIFFAPRPLGLGFGLAISDDIVLSLFKVSNRYVGLETP